MGGYADDPSPVGSKVWVVCMGSIVESYMLTLVSFCGPVKMSLKHSSSRNGVGG